MIEFFEIINTTMMFLGYAATGAWIGKKIHNFLNEEV